MKAKLYLALIAMFLQGCATQVTMTGKQYPPVEPLAVKVLFYDKPECTFEELAFISRRS